MMVEVVEGKKKSKPRMRVPRLSIYKSSSRYVEDRVRANVNAVYVCLSEFHVLNRFVCEFANKSKRRLAVLWSIAQALVGKTQHQ